MDCLPESLAGRKYYTPTEQGQEARVKERMEQIDEWRKRHKSDD
jgi:putative ATPase